MCVKPCRQSVDNSVVECVQACLSLLVASAEEEFAALLARVQDDPRVVGVVLSGSHARQGMATEHSDYDVALVANDDAVDDLRHASRRDGLLDVWVTPLSEFRREILTGDSPDYSYVHAQVLKDTPDQLIADLVQQKASLTADQAAGREWTLDAFLNSAYRALKNDRDGNPFAYQLDAADAIGFHLYYVFALHRRERPYNKYLHWELTHYPLPAPEWAPNHLLPLLTAAVSPTGAPALRQLLNELEPHAREAGHGSTLDDWGEDLAFMQGQGL